MRKRRQTSWHQADPGWLWRHSPLFRRIWFWIVCRKIGLEIWFREICQSCAGWRGPVGWFFRQVMPPLCCFLHTIFRFILYFTIVFFFMSLPAWPFFLQCLLELFGSTD